MKHDPSGPAETREMGIVHSALRRDLERARIVLAGRPDPVRAQAIGRHLVWMMELLHHHHTNEDDHYWPATLERNPAAAPLLERMEADHQGLVGPIAEQERTADDLGAGRGDPASVVAAIDALAGPLHDHLRREELEMMPVVAQSWTYAEHEEFGKLWIEGKSRSQLGQELMWLTDNADAEARELMLGKVPRPVAFVLRHTSGRRYARLKNELWGGTPAFDLPPITVEPEPA